MEDHYVPSMYLEQVIFVSIKPLYCVFLGPYKTAVLCLGGP